MKLLKEIESLYKNIKLFYINQISNLLLLIYSYKIGRDEAKKKIMKDEIPHIIKIYNEINSVEIKDEKQFIEKYFEPFLKGWKKIKSKAFQYQCRLLRNFEKGEKPLDMNLDLPLCFFLVDDGDKDGGMFLASAYEQMIKWQNDFIEIIIENNKISGIHNSYVSQLEQEVNIQDASKEEIVTINEKTYKIFNDFIYSTAIRNIFSKDNKIIYKNYNDLEYDFEFIEEELGRVILPGIKKFRINKINFIIYLFEGLRASHSSILLDYNAKYPPKKLNEDEEKKIEELSQINKSNKFYNEVFSSLQILMNEIVKGNYEPSHLIYKIIETLPVYIILNKELKNMFKETYEYYLGEKIFSLNTLVSIFEYFEALCWKEIRKKVAEDCKLKISDEAKKYITEYFANDKEKKNLINQKNFTTALRRFISRSLAGSRQESEIKLDALLHLYINREDLWPKEFYNEINSEKFINEIFIICNNYFIVGNCLDLYDFLEGDNYLNEEIDKNKGKLEEKNKDKNEDKIEEIDNKNNNLNEEEQVEEDNEENEESVNKDREYDIDY